MRDDSLLSRTAVAGCAVWFYLGKLVWPFHLCMFYPTWRIDQRDIVSYLPGVLLVMLLALAWWRRRTWGRTIVMLMVCYVGLLLPALGFVNVYFMRYSLVADHYQYAAMIVPCAVFAGVAATRIRAWLPSNSERLPGLLLLAVLAILSWQQSRMYTDAQTLYRTTIDMNPNCWMAHNNLGLALAGEGKVDEAIIHYQEALQSKPDFAEGHNNLGPALAGRGQIDEAIAQYRQALKIDPEFVEAQNDLGIALAGRGKLDEAMAHFRRALEINPDCLESHYNLGVALAAGGQFDEAITQYRKALEIAPDDASVCYSLGLALASQGRFAEAIRLYQKTLGPVSARNDRGMADEIRAQIRRCQSVLPAEKVR